MGNIDCCQRSEPQQEAIFIIEGEESNRSCLPPEYNNLSIMMMDKASYRSM